MDEAERVFWDGSKLDEGVPEGCVIGPLEMRVTGATQRWDVRNNPAARREIQRESKPQMFAWTFEDMRGGTKSRKPMNINGLRALLCTDSYL